MTNVPRDLQDEIDAEVRVSLERGMGVRRRNVLWSGFWLVAVFLALTATGAPIAIVVAVMLIVSTLSLIWAVMSMSASINAQFDVLTVMLSFYAEKKAQQMAPADAGRSRG